MRFKFIPFILLMLATTIVSEGAETQEFIPGDCITVITVLNIKTDPGVSWLIDSWIKSPKKTLLREFFASTRPEEASMAVFPDEPINYLAVFDLPQVNKEAIKRLTGVIASDTTTVKEISYKGADITFNTQKDTMAFSAYAIFKDKLLLSTDIDLLKKAIEGGTSIKKTQGYAEMEGSLPQVKDGLFFASNLGSRFANFLSSLEEKWKLTLLMSAEYLDWIGSSFDVVDSTSMSGEIVFRASDKSHINDIRDDAEFLGEAFKRKFMAEKIQYSSDVTVGENTVTLRFRVTGLEPLWRDLFAQGLLSLIK